VDQNASVGDSFSCPVREGRKKGSPGERMPRVKGKEVGSVMGRSGSKMTRMQTGGKKDGGDRGAKVTRRMDLRGEPFIQGTGGRDAEVGS